MSYISFFITSVPRDRVADYQKLAERMGELWIQHGALEVQEFLGVDVPLGTLTSYPRAVQAQDGEVIITGFVRYASKEDKDRIMEAVMSDPSMQPLFNDAPMDGQKMIFGDFEQMLCLS